MNIFIVNHYGEPPTTGKNIRHYQFAKKLIERGYKVKIFTASTIHTTDVNYIDDKKIDYKEENIGGVPFVFIRTCNYNQNGKKRLLNIIQYAYRVLFVTKRFNLEKPDIIYASSAHPLAWLSGYRLSKRHNAKFIVETRDLWPETLIALGKLNKNGIIAKTLYKIEKFVYIKADKIIFTFPGGKDYINSIELDSDKIEYINNGVDLNEFNNDKERHVINDNDLSDNNSFKILYTGAIGLANSLNHLVEAAKIIKDMGYERIKFVIYGDGFLKTELEGYVKDNHIDNVVFKGRVEKKYVPYILSKSDLNVFTGEHLSVFKYGLSLNKMFDYFASGKPTLSNIECGYDLLKEHKCGLTVKGGDPQALATGILKFYNMPVAEYNKYCDNALKASQEYDFKVLTDKLEKIILETTSTNDEKNIREEAYGSN